MGRNGSKVYLEKKITTPKGGVIHVLSKGLQTSSGRSYLCECSLCSLDKDLWQKGELVYTTRDIRNSRILCGCSDKGVQKYNARQRVVLCTREAAKYGLTFVDWKNGWCGSKTYCCLRSSEDGEYYYPRIDRLFSGQFKHKPPKQTVQKKKIDHQKIVEDKLISLGSQYTINYNQDKSKKGHRRMWDVICPLCATDNLATVGGNVFTVREDSLLAGRLPCRCSPKYVYSKEERDKLAKDEMERRGFTDLGWAVEDSQLTKSKVKFICCNNHTDSMFFHNFIQGACCYMCSVQNNPYSFYEARADEPDNLYLLRFEKEEEIFYKVGRSFNIKKRLFSYPREYAITRVCEVKRAHKEVYLLEQNLHTELAAYHYNPLIPFSGSKQECFTEDILVTDSIRETFNLY